MEEVFKTIDIFEGINVNGENLTNLRFARDATLFNEKTKQMEKHLNSLNSKSLTVGLNILSDQEKFEKVTEFKYLWQTTHLKDTIKEIYAPTSPDSTEQDLQWETACWKWSSQAVAASSTSWLSALTPPQAPPP